jgi:signal transduction histidine kinase
VWERRARDAFVAACRTTLRTGDAVAHEAGSNLFLVALFEPNVAAGLPRIARAVLAQIVRHFTAATGLWPEHGWTLYAPGAEEPRLREAAAAALNRGRRERERFAFFATLGHEMRSPIMSVEGYLAALFEGNLDAATRRRFTELAQLEAVRLRRLVESMFALSLVELDAELIRASCSAQRAVERACDAIYPAAAGRGANVRICSRSEAAVPLAEETAVHVFVALLENAVKHGREYGRIEVRLEESPSELVIFFDDDGAGIARAERAAVFEPFTRGAGATAAGYGFGLSMVRATIERAGGAIEALASPLGGARFAVRLPQATLRAAHNSDTSETNVPNRITLRSP